MNEQTKILETLKREFEGENVKMEQSNAAVQESKANLLKLKEQLQITENEIQEKQKAKDDIIENSSKRDSMIAYLRKNVKTLADAMVKYEVNKRKQKTQCISIFWFP